MSQRTTASILATAFFFVTLRLAPWTLAAASPTSTAKLQTYGQYGGDALASLLRQFYAGNGRWSDCDLSSRLGCAIHNVDWGSDSLTYTLYVAWRSSHDPVVASTLAALVGTTTHYPAPCKALPCGAWSDVANWDAVAAAREYEATGQAQSLVNAERAFDEIEGSPVYTGGACPRVRYQRPAGGPNHLKTLETDAAAIKAALLLYHDTAQSNYLTIAQRRYAAVRQYFLDPAVPLYTVYLFDDGLRCTQVPHRFFASVNGEMITNGMLLATATGDATYRDQALATANAVVANLSDARGIYADLQAENDVAEPLVEAMDDLAATQPLARTWISTNAAAATGARRSSGTYGRFFDGPPPAGVATAWQVDGGAALEIVAGQLMPATVVPAQPSWSNATFVADPLDALPSGFSFTGSGVAVIGTIGARCCQAGHAAVLVDGTPTFDQTGIWQNKSSSDKSLPHSVLFAWQWAQRGQHTIHFVVPDTNAKEGGPYLHIDGYYTR